MRADKNFHLMNEFFYSIQIADIRIGISGFFVKKKIEYSY